MSEYQQKQAEYEKRFALLRIKYPPINAFVKETLPFPGRGGEVVFKRALALKRSWSAEHWQMKLADRSKEDRENCQVVVIPPRDPNNNNKDFSSNLHEELKKTQLGRHPVARLERQDYKGDTGDIGRKIIGKKKVKTVYIVASIIDDHDMADVQHVASQYKMYGEDVEVNLVTPFLKAERDDKSIELLKDKKKKIHTGKIVSILTTMQALSPFVNNIFTNETHSSATQAFAAMFGMDLIPLSLYEELLTPMRNEIKDPKEWRIIRPDVGRNMIARRLSTILKMKGVSLSKFRKGDTIESQSSPLTENEIKSLSGKNALLYDDEGATFGTITDITLNHLLRAKVKSINILLGHLRLQNGWDKNLEIMIKACQEKGVPFKIYATDSRVPIGDLHKFMEKYPGSIQIVSIVDKTLKTIDASINGVDFYHNNHWGDVDWERLILQPIPGYDFKSGNNHHS